MDHECMDSSDEFVNDVMEIGSSDDSGDDTEQTNGESDQLKYSKSAWKWRKRKAKNRAKKQGNEVSTEAPHDIEENSEVQQDVYLPRVDGDEDPVDPEDLECDESAYILFHRAHTGAPCLSFDILEDQLGNDREDYPLTQYIVCGTQSSKSHLNQVIVMKLHNLHRNKHRDSDDEESESDDEDGSRVPELSPAAVKHPLGAVNRIRSTILNETHYAASWCERGVVYIWDLSTQLNAVEDLEKLKNFDTENVVKPSYEYTGHGIEGFSMDWSKLTPGQLLTGDCNKKIHLWKPVEGGEWSVNQRPYIGHNHSVEDIQWSPSESSVFASCSVDKSVRIWDIRAAPDKANMLTANEAHDRDVNVISWNSNEPFIISGGDDSLIKIWDLRMFAAGRAVARFDYHKGPITSVEWHPHDGSVFAAAGEDDLVTQWDLGVEKDEDADNDDYDIPPQLLFLHQGQSDVKEIHWHKQCTGVLISTASTGFNVFRTISV